MQCLEPEDVYYSRNPSEIASRWMHDPSKFVGLDLSSSSMMPKVLVGDCAKNQHEYKPIVM